MQICECAFHKVVQLSEGLAGAIAGRRLTIDEKESCFASRESSVASREFNSGGHGEGETPVPVPNTAVKPLSGESSWLVTAREVSTLPGLMLSKSPATVVLFFYGLGAYPKDHHT